MQQFALFVAAWSAIACIVRIYDAIDYRDRKAILPAIWWAFVCGWAVYVISTAEVMP